MANSHLRITSDRIPQLRAIANHRNTTITGILDSLVVDELRAGTIPDATPGIAYEPTNGELAVTIDGEAFTISIQGARDLADTLDSPGRRTMVMSDATSGVVLFEVGRIGHGVEFKLTHGGPSVHRYFTPSVARDVARQMRAACDQMSKAAA